MSTFITKLTLLSLFLFSFNAYSTANLQIIGGQRTAKFYAMSSSEESTVETSSEEPSSEGSYGKPSDNYIGGEIGLSVLAQLSPYFPLALGGSILHQNLKGDSPDRKESYSGTLLAAELMTWANLGFLSPFVKGSYDLYSDHNLKIEGEQQKFFSVDEESTKTIVEVEGKVSGYHIAVGTKFRLAPLINAVLQGDMAEEKFKSDRFNVSQSGFGFFVEESDIMPERKVMSYAISLGLDVGI